MEVVKDVKACSEKGRLKAKGDYERWDTRRLIVNSDLMLNMEPRLESMGMDSMLFHQGPCHAGRGTAYLVPP